MMVCRGKREEHRSCKIKQNIQENGMQILIREMERELKHGLMEVSMMAIGRMIKQMVEAG